MNDLPEFAKLIAMRCVLKLPLEYQERAYELLNQQWFAEPGSEIIFPINNYQLRARWLRRELKSDGGVLGYYWLCSCDVVAFSARDSGMETHQ
jgi:hypothetical protein